jgi:outer membrane protein assembly factor BamB
MKHTWIVILFLATMVAGLLVAGCTNTGTPPPGGGPLGPGTAGIPPEVSQHAQDWPLPNKDYASTRAATNSPITSANVKNLQVTWVMPITAKQTFGGASSNPLIMGNTVYFQDLMGRLFSVNRQTGAANWVATFDSTGVVGPNGPAAGYGKVFGASNRYSVSAVDASSGNRLWTTNLSFGKPIGVLEQPVVYDGKVLVSTTPYGYLAGSEGIIYALDQQTGKILWNFSTIQDPNLWGHPELNSGGGAWYSPSIDVNTGNSFWGIGNPAPMPGVPGFPNGGSRPGNNLYCDSLVVLDNSGKLVWYAQALAHDNTDMDFQLPAILTSANINGVQQDIAIGGGKWGRVFAFNRGTGAILWETPVGMHLNDNLVNLPNGTIRVYPGFQGGIETMMAYADGVVYVPNVNLYAEWQPDSPFPHAKLQPYAEGKGNLTAIQVSTGKVLWETNFDSELFAAATVVNDLVFTATFDGTIYALNRNTGEIIWTYDAPAGFNAWPAVAGDTLIWPGGFGKTPGLFAFRLATPGAAPQVKISSPAAGSTVEGSTVSVTAWVQNFNLADKLGKPNVAGEGHLHFFLDAQPPTVQGKPAVTTPGTYVPTAVPYYFWTNVTMGQHTLSTELVNNDHTPLDPPVVDSVTITVAPLPPGVAPELTPELGGAL